MIKLYIGELEIDITSFVDENSIAYSDNIDETKAHGGFTIPYIKNNDLLSLDMSNPLPRLTKVYINIDNEETYWKLSEDKVVKIRKGVSPLYRHEISLIEPTIDIEKRVIPDMTITQPKGVLDNYVYMISSINEDDYEQIYFQSGETIQAEEQQGLRLDNTPLTLTFDYGLSNDTAVVTNNTLKEVREYDLILNAVVYNTQYMATTPYSPETTLKLGIYANGVLVETFSDDLLEAYGSGFLTTTIKPFIKNITHRISYTPSAANEVITVKAYTDGMLDAIAEDSLWIVKMGFTIQTFDETVDTPKYYLDEVVDKILKNVEAQPKAFISPEFTLDEQSKNRLSGILSPEYTFTSYTLYQALNEIASYVGAIVYVGEDDWNTIYFYFYDDEQNESGITYLEEEKNAYLTDYVTGLEINAKNVIKEDDERYAQVDPSATGWLSIRGNGIDAISDANATVHTSKPIYKEYKLLVKGLAFNMLDSVNNPVSFASTIEWDVTNYVVEQTKWNALSNISSANSRSSALNRGNTVYYVQGQKNINNIGYNDVLLAPAWNTATPANAAIIEAILCQAQVENPSLHFSSTYTVSTSLFNLRFRFQYMPYSNARVMVYRDDAVELNKAHKYFNETANLNDMKSLGDIAKKHVNRKGNVLSSYVGKSRNIRNLVRLGMKNSNNEVLSSYEMLISPTIRTFRLNYSKFNPNISEYKGTPSAYRQWEVPNTDLVYRKDKYSEFVYLSEVEETSTFSIYDIEQLLENFRATPNGLKLTYAQLELDYTGTGYTEIVEATIDTLAFGNTSAIVIEMHDNYSAGAKVVEGVAVGNITQKRQTDTRYTDDLGRVENIKVLTYITHAPSDTENYPDNNDVVSNPQSELELNVKKDAREIWGITQELVFRSNYANIKIYSGFAKFNGLVMKGSAIQTQPFLLKKGYFPTSESIDMTKLIQADWLSTIISNELYTQFTTPIGEYEGYIWMELKSFQPIFAVKTTAFDTLVGGALGHEVYIYTSYSTLIPNFTESIATEIGVYDNITIELSTDYELDLTDTITVISSISDFISIDITTSLSGSIGLSDSISVEVSTDYEIDLSGTIGVLSSISETQVSKTWVYIGTTSGTYDVSVSYILEGSVCPVTGQTATWLATNYPAENYTYGTIIRVVRGNTNLVPCTPVAYYYQAL